MKNSVLDEVEERRRKLLEITHSVVGRDRASLGSESRLVKDTVPLGIPEVDNILGGGLRMGRMALVVGTASTGKTLFTQWVISAIQKRGGICGFMDPEKTYEPAWMSQTGVDTENIVIVHPSSTEQAFDLACRWSEEGVDLIVIDSLAALTPQLRVDADLTAKDVMGVGARKITEGLNVFTRQNTNSLLLCTNQLRSKIGVSWGSPDEIPGGRALTHYASYTIRLRRKGWIEEGGTRVGYNLSVYTEKNKLHPPFQTAVVPFMFSGHIDNVMGGVELAIDLGVITRRGAYYTWDDERYQGKKKLMAYFYDNKDAFGQLQERILSVE